MKRLTSDQKNQIISLYQQGTPTIQIAKQFDIYNNSVTRILRKNGIERNQRIQVSQEKIDQIIIDYSSGISSETIADKLGINGSTVCRILKRNGVVIRPATQNKIHSQIKNNTNIQDKHSKHLLKSTNPDKYGTTYIPIWNNILLNSDNLKTMSTEDKQLAADYLVDFYREGGFPYTKLTNDEIIKDFTALKNSDANAIVQGKNLTLYNQAGVATFKHFSPQFFEVNCGSNVNKLSMLSAFNNDDALKKTIINRLQGNYNMTGNMMKQGLANSKLAFKSSIFNPTVAKFIYSQFTKEGSIIYDYSMGFGQRLLGALSLPHNLTYVGVDPWEKCADSNRQIFDFLSQNIPGLNKKIDLSCVGSENYCDDKYVGKIDIAFSSPPYYNLEVYCDDQTQAYKGGYGSFINKWWRQTASNIDRLLSSTGIFAINIKERVDGFNLAEDMCNVIKEYGFVLIDTYCLQLTRNTSFRNIGEHKLEPVFIFARK